MTNIANKDLILNTVEYINSELNYDSQRHIISTELIQTITDKISKLSSFEEFLFLVGQIKKLDSITQIEKSTLFRQLLQYMYKKYLTDSYFKFSISCIANDLISLFYELETPYIDYIFEKLISDPYGSELLQDNIPEKLTDFINSFPENFKNTLNSKIRERVSVKAVVNMVNNLRPIVHAYGHKLNSYSRRLVTEEIENHIKNYVTHEESGRKIKAGLFIIFFPILDEQQVITTLKCILSNREIRHLFVKTVEETIIPQYTPEGRLTIPQLKISENVINSLTKKQFIDFLELSDDIARGLPYPFFELPLQVVKNKAASYMLVDPKIAKTLKIILENYEFKTSYNVMKRYYEVLHKINTLFPTNGNNTELLVTILSLPLTTDEKALAIRIFSTYKKDRFSSFRKDRETAELFEKMGVSIEFISKIESLIDNNC